MANFIEKPRYTCALGGAITTAQALPKPIPILHAPSGCAGNAAWTQAGGYCGGLSMPGSNIPYINTGLPIGPSATDSFLRTVGSALELDKKVIEAVIRAENRRYYQILEPLADCYNDADLQRYAVVAGDGNYAPAIAKFLADDIGWLPEVVAVTDILFEEQQNLILARINNFNSGLKPQTVFASDTSEIARIVKEHWAEQEEKNGSYSNPLTPAFVIGSSFERALAKDLGAAHLSVSFPVSNRAVLDRGYASYSGGLRLLEDLISAIIPGR